MSPFVTHAAVLVALTASPQVEVDVQAIIEQATQLAAQIDEQDVPQLLTDIGSARARIGDRCEAVDLFDRSLQALELIWENEVEHRILFTYLVDARARAGDVTGAIRTANAFPESDLSAYAHELIATAQAEAGDFVGALKTSDAIGSTKGISPKSSALASVAIALADAGDFEEASQIVERIETLRGDDQLQRMLISNDRDFALEHIAVTQAGGEADTSSAQTASRIRNERIRLRTLCEIANAQAESGNSADARKILEQALAIAKPGRDQDQLWSIASTQAVLGDFEDSLRTASSIIEGPDKGGALLDIAIAQQKAGDEDAAAKTFEKGLRILKAADPSEFGYALQEIATRFADSGDLNRAMEVIDLMESEDSTRHFTLRMIATGQIKTGNFTNAREIAAKITDPYHRAVALRDLASALAKEEDSAAAETFRKAFEAAVQIERGGGSNVIMLREIGAAQLKAGDRSGAAKTFEQARKTAFDYQDESYAAQLIQDVAKVQAEGGDAEGALTWATAQQSPIVKTRSLLGVAQGMIEAKSSSEQTRRSQ